MSQGAGSEDFSGQLSDDDDDTNEHSYDDQVKLLIFIVTCQNMFLFHKILLV